MRFVSFSWKHSKSVVNDSLYSSDNWHVSSVLHKKGTSFMGTILFSWQHNERVEDQIIGRRSSTVQGNYSTGKLFHRETIPQGNYSTGKLLHKETTPQGNYSTGKLLHRETTPQGNYSTGNIFHREYIRKIKNTPLLLHSWIKSFSLSIESSRVSVSQRILMTIS